MGEPKPVASLSSGLLARKGHAKPAMRPQGFGGFSGFGGQDDLGWNDMGHDVPKAVAFPSGAELDEQALPEQPLPPVVLQREELAEEFNTVEEYFDAGEEEEGEDVAFDAPVLTTRKKSDALPVPRVAIARAKKAVRGRKGKAAFTLRLDAERHLKLKLACAIERASAQAIVTEALDRFLADRPELDDLARKVPASATK
ncbi:hypothetical protein [Sphingomonas cavernae]|uniref:Uncharacterized protein n=1 Tax=Sphingomonas cavernae TaxID=2320861 RepID=A0A418WNN6_9SPHN|nr:hypothetical protein [Sphingomonas cavernae]RJF91623.1 hypothetical protein D3876_15275 [Sphingomonas cavernae]